MSRGMKPLNRYEVQRYLPGTIGEIVTETISARSYDVLDGFVTFYNESEKVMSIKHSSVNSIRLIGNDPPAEDDDGA